jgi:hydroxysqualene synthase
MRTTGTDTIEGMDRPALSHPVHSLREAFAYCEHITREHYENFPVASFFIPKQKRPYVWSIYAFARTADDIADEGAISTAERLHKLDQMGVQLDRCFEGRAEEPVFIALAETVARNGIPKKLLADLLTAFRWDITKNRFATFDELLLYCKHSANPIGQLVLYIFSCATPRACVLSDSICTALQLANFWQDIAIDWAKGRCYIPLEDFKRFGYTEYDLQNHVVDERFRRLMEFELDRTGKFFAEGRPLLHEGVRDLKLELRLTWLGGRTVLKKIRAAGCDVFTQRPTISAVAKLAIIAQALFSPSSWMHPQQP